MRSAIQINRNDILLVEDDPDDRESFIAALAEAGGMTLFDVVHNGKEALHRLQGSLVLPSLIVMDVNMPVMNGLDCLEKLKNDPLMKSIPVVILSTSSMARKKALQLGAMRFVSKPSGDKELVACIREITGFVLRLKALT